ncbi:uncharacterized protein LOC128239202 isoform X1 [Mya arenaria]|uniref:uncharacterized protein LOC128239202 isoform X1 n=2 Tax=Mya arenaria TaxID=6604 RepID=UPI0022E2A1D1|nr:uncharacterized protein LOC128239202 isoform X1 [Mya arenaria]XP_052811685.1 uncharacterized protein LOC128239202 isoform X1 [Mya arenaria]XP_052811686.1 uncharacterized protein LOC128239202 isoform X1 [Mya arenaria]XP_052811687.1 uncharacterized protein LOC128239202 isoform X1 [Mya arenaria]XP_052811688.1 uncharacterized protein LOC128239202 isoform X1 [Mya arenaria]XP_052811689.1 uncharacterized protein LOC128239202 isoform X1 [Mya arenaria]XP_052811690.1 uncharacterized protein LOC12823
MILLDVYVQQHRYISMSENGDLCQLQMQQYCLEQRGHLAIGCGVCNFTCHGLSLQESIRRHIREVPTTKCLAAITSVGGLEVSRICAKDGLVYPAGKKDFVSSLLEVWPSDAKLFREIVLGSPATLNMSQGICRRMSFSHMDPRYLHRIDTDGLSEAGFYYSIERDSVRCYYCDISIGKWRDHVYNRDPFVEHCLTHPYCPHIILTKGLFYVDEVLLGKSRKRQRNAEESNDNDIVKKKLRDIPTVDRTPHHHPRFST